ncbi:MAG: hypothetical protein PHV30_01980 [Candidatus Margulisbacteria bacterium]|nr:hypothetical protein [Candidatus Margulisiibacteriota bacterium]
MNNKYYYLIASLPSLKFNTKPLINKETFFEECRKWLTSQDLLILNTVDTNVKFINIINNNFLINWYDYNLKLKTELAILRDPSRKNMDSVNASAESRKIMEQVNPLLKEKAYEKFRWDFLDSEETKYNFDLNILIIYLEKLKILDRLFLFNKELGYKKFEVLKETYYEHAIR